MNTFDPKLAHMLREPGHVPTLNEQAAIDVRRARHHAPWYNAGVAFLLRSPLHGLISRSVMLVSVKGRKTGSVITTPVNYMMANDGWVYVVSLRSRKLWRNLRASAPVALRLRGQDRRGVGSVITNARAVTDALARVLDRAPDYARSLHIHRSADGALSLVDLQAAARRYVLICIQLEARAA
jgi:hypothetical protein